MQRNVLKVVVVSPSDVAPERVAASRVIEETSRLIALQWGGAIECWRWEVDAHPGFHVEGPQGLIDDLMQIHQADVVVGIFWKRFGTPTSIHGSGTEHELEKAIASWRERQRPQVMVYFNAAAAAPNTIEEIDQWRSVIEFRQRFPKDGLWWSYAGEDEFERLFRGHLQTYLLTQKAASSQSQKEFSGLLDLPAAHDAVDRPVAAQTLRDAMAENSIVVIGGLSGSGKTYLAASHFNSTCLNSYDLVLWHDPSPGESLDNLLAKLDESIRLDGESAVSRCKALTTQLRTKNAVLVVDNFHVVDQASYAVLLSSLSAAAAPCRLLLLSQTYVISPGATFNPCHIQLQGLGVSESRQLLKKKGLPDLADYFITELLHKTGGLPFAVSLFALLVVDFGHDPNDLLAGTMESASRIRTWFDRILECLDLDARRLLSSLALLDVPFNIGVVKAIGRGLLLQNIEATFESLQRHFLTTKHTHYRWSVHELIRVLAQPLMTAEERSNVNGLLGHHFLRGLPKRRGAILSADEFLSKVNAFRHLARCSSATALANAVLEELSGTAKIRGHYALFVELSRMTVRNSESDLPWLAYHHAHCALILGHPEYCRRIAEPLLYNPKVVSNAQLRLSMTRLYAEALGGLRLQEAAIPVLRDTILAAPDVTKSSIPYVQAKSALSWLLTRHGSHIEAAELARELLADAQRRNDSRGGAIGWAQLGMAQRAAGRFSEAINSLDSAAELFSSVGDRRGTAWARIGAAECKLATGELNNSERDLREATAITADIGECSIDLQDALERMLQIDPPPLMLDIINSELNRVRQQARTALHSLEQ